VGDINSRADRLNPNATLTLPELQGLSKLLGHSSIAITLDLYSHVLPNMQNEAAEGVDQARGGNGSSGEIERVMVAIG
jgi:hypothetical protein